MNLNDICKVILLGFSAFTPTSVSMAEGQSVAPLRGEAGEPIVILNIAADALVDYLRTKEPLDGGASRTMIIDGLKEMVDQYEGTNVTHLCFNVSYHRAAYRSKVWESYWDDESPENYLTGWPKKYWLIHQKKIDPFSVVVNRCREKRISPWVSIRMNDTHHLREPNRASRLWLEHPELRLREWGGFDFTHAEVRRHYLALIEELVQRYDVDGVELDWMRYADLFKPGEALRKRHVLTEFMRKVRRIVSAAEMDSGHPVKLSVRVPARPDFAKGLGMDVVSWIRNGLVDIIVPCSTWNPSHPDVPVESWREAIGSTSHVYLIAPGTDLWISGGQSRPFMRSNMETMRGFSASMLDRGADAIYLFNHFARTDSKVWHLGDDGMRRSHHTMLDLLKEAGSMPKSIAGPRRHILTNHDPVPPNSNYKRPLPAVLNPNHGSELSINLGPESNSGQITLRVGLMDRGALQKSKLKAQFNGVDCGPFADMPKPKHAESTTDSWKPTLSVASVADRVIQCEVPLHAAKRGYNIVTLRLSTETKQEVVWLECLVAPQQQAEAAPNR